MKTYSVLAVLAALVFFPCASTAQVAINSVSSVSTITVSGGTLNQVISAHPSSVNGVTPSANYTVKYNNNANVSISSFSVSGKTYVRFSGFDTVILRRAANAYETTGGNKQHIYCQGASSVDNTTFQMPFPVAFPQVSNYAYMERVMKDGLINRGSDNVFNNDGTSDLTFNNIERVDFVYKAGIGTTATSAAGFVIAERGGNDAFKIAAITGVDVNGNPTSFGSVVSVPTSAYGAAILNAPTYVMRKDASDNTLRPFSLVPTQAVKSVFIRFSDLGIAPLQKVYGYALMGNDVTATTGAQVLDFTNTTYFPRTTNNTDGGMDLASAPGIFHTDLILDAKLMSVTVQNKNCDQLLNWVDEDYLRVKEYQLEKSLDGEHFEKIAAVPAGGGSQYNYTDRSFTASCYYRVKAVLLEGTFYYSGIMFARNTCNGASVSVFPNPVQDKINIRFDGDMKTDMITLVTADGREYGRWKVMTGTSLVQMDVNALPAGQYFIRLSAGNQLQKTMPVVKR